MQTGHTWDTNWKYSPIAEEFRYDQYNFSGYHVAVRCYAGVVQAIKGRPFSDYNAAVQWYRWFSLLFGVGSAVLATLLGLRLGGIWAGLLAGGLTALHPQLVQDGHYARAETFFTFITLVNAWLVLGTGHRRFVTVFLAALLAGFAFSIKVSGLITLVFPVLALFQPGTGWARYTRSTVLLIIGWTLGAFLGMPGAFGNPSGYLYGIHRLREQYFGLQPPHSFPDGRLIWPLALDYYFQTLWPVTLLAFACGCVALLHRRRFQQAFGLLVPFLVTILYFSLTRVFFERNNSHVLPLGFIVAGIGMGTALESLKSRPMRGAVALGCLGLVLCAPGQLTSRLINQALTNVYADRDEAIASKTFGEFPQAQGFALEICDIRPDMWTKLNEKARSGRRTLLRVTDFQDPGSAQNLEALQHRYNLESAASISLFPEMPVCTLTTYHAPTYRYFWMQGIRHQVN